MGADCKSVGESLHKFESCTCHPDQARFSPGLISFRGYRFLPLLPTARLACPPVTDFVDDGVAVGEPIRFVGTVAAITQRVAAPLAGVPLVGALQGVLQSLRADPAITAAVDATLPAALRSALSTPAVKRVIGGLAYLVVLRLDQPGRVAAA